jgi:hypothetical protein
LLTLAAVEVAAVSSAIWLVIDLDPVGTPLGAAGQALADPYVLFGLAAIAAAGALERQRAATSHRSRTRGRVRQQPLRVIPEAVSGP